ncbi:MAG: hypothetical protein K8M05_11205 [Deltaproteobacteria bacterium]|nr:hypothetical protein [Kofleriaceae bacterium]
MRTVSGAVLVKESSRGVAGLTVTAFTHSNQARSRVGSVATDDEGRFSLEYRDADEKLVWNLQLEVSVDGPEPRVLFTDGKPRVGAGERETWTIRLPLATLVEAGVLRAEEKSAAASELPALGTFLARAVADSSYETEVQTTVRARLDPLRDAAAATAAAFRAELVVRDRGESAPPPDMPVGTQLATVLSNGIASGVVRRPRRGYVPVSAAERARLLAAAGPNGAIAAEAIEPLLHGHDRVGERTAVDLLAAACRSPRTLDGACAATSEDPSTPPSSGNGVRDLADAVWAELQPRREQGHATRPSASDVWRKIEGLEVAGGPSDAPALHDFHAIHIPFEDVWRDLIDEEAVETAAQLHDEVVRQGGRPSNGSTGSTDVLRREARFLAREAPAAMKQRRFPGGLLQGLGIVTGLPDPLGDDGTRWVSALLDELERKLHEPYRFTVYAADDTGTAINFGLVTTYRQVWRPLSYQAGKLVKTVTLAPREERTYSRTVTTATKRRTETKEKFRNVTRSEEQSTQRAVRDIVGTAEHRTGYEASGSYGPVSGSVNGEDSRTSSDTRQSFREAVRKASSEYESDRSVDISFETSEQAVAQDTGKLTNPNDELAVTFLFYQLQRRYHVSERFHRVMPVILVAQAVPRPNHINITWILQHDWILRRVLLDASFAPALDLVTGSLVGEEATVGQLRSNLDTQRQVVAALKDSLVSAHANSDVLFQAVQRAIRRAAGANEPDGLVAESVKAVVSWMIGGDSDEVRRARLDAAREALDRSEANERAIAEQLQREQATLTIMTDKWAAASRALLDKTVEVQRLRLHIKQNILYYMQAIWDHEPPDQRYFRLHQIKVPVIGGSLRYRLEEDDSLPPLPPHWTKPLVVRADIEPELTGETVPLGQVADLDRPLGYKGNYAIFPLREPNLVTRYMMIPYVDAENGAHDPDHLANLTRSELEAYYCCVKEHLSPEELEQIRPGLDETHRRVLTDPRPLEEIIVVPTDALFIEALPADQPILEDFKLRHRAADAAKAEAEAAKARLENVRRGARILGGQLADPDIEKMTLIEGRTGSIVVPGDE